MNARVTVALVLSAAALGGGYWAWEVKGRPQREQAKEDAKRVFPELNAEATGEILLRKEKLPEVLLRQTGGEWRLIKPVQTLADKEAVAELLKQLKDVKREEVVEEKAADLRKYGLDEPSGAVTFLPLSAGAKPQVLFFGADSFDGSKIYALVDGKQDVFLTAIAGKSALLKDADGLREKRLANFEPSAVTSVRSSVSGGFVAAKDKDGQWQVTAGAQKEPGDGPKIEAWLRELAAIKGESVVDEDGTKAARYGLGAARVELNFQGGGQQVLLKGKLKDKGPSFYGRLQGLPQVWLLPASAETAFGKTGRALMELHAFDLKPGLVDHFTLWQQGTTLTAKRKDDLSWAWDTPVKAAAGAPAFDFHDFIAGVGGAERLSRLPDSAKPAHPLKLLTFFDERDQTLEVVWVGGLQGGGQLAFSGSKRMASVVASNLFNALPPAPAKAP